MTLTVDRSATTRSSVDPPLAQPAGPRAERPAVTILLRGLLCLGFFGLVLTLWLVVLSALPHHRHQMELERSFLAALANGVAPVDQPVPTGAPLALLEIPTLDVEEIVVEGTDSQQLARGPGHLRTSSLLNQPGVSVVIGRRVAYGGPFCDLDELQLDDTVTVTTGQGRVEYRVAEVRTHAADDASAFVAAGPALLLVSSDPPIWGSARIVAVARPISDVFPPGVRVRQPPAAADELGLAGSRRAAVGLLIWAQLFVVAALAGLFLTRRWRRWPGWMLVAPVVAALGWVMLEQLSLLLPAAL